MHSNNQEQQNPLFNNDPKDTVGKMTLSEQFRRLPYTDKRGKGFVFSSYRQGIEKDNSAVVNKDEKPKG